jgi:ditrans,polycis-polyprenyl diphosphate synthase
MDGNARWALENNLPTNAGHERGVEALRRVIQVCAEWNINVITVYAFSHENWRRQKDEVSYLMELFEKTLTDELPDLIEQDIRVSVMGDLGMVSDDLRAAIKQTTEKTKYNKKMKLNVALSYGARQDLVAATRSLALDCAAGLIASEDITEQMIAERLSSNFGGSVYGQTDSGADSASPDLLIRTSGEQRLSNFMLWECAYTEFYFTETLWPEFGEEALRHALETYASRQRRFGVRSGGE